MLGNLLYAAHRARRFLILGGCLSAVAVLAFMLLHWIGH